MPARTDAFWRVDVLSDRCPCPDLPAAGDAGQPADSVDSVQNSKEFLDRTSWPDKESTMLIDIHTHSHLARHPSIVRHGNGLCWPTPERLIAMMDEAGIDMAVVQGCTSPERRWTLVIPEEVLEICARYPGRLIPFCNVDPRCLAHGPESDFRPLLAAYRELGCKGVGEYFPNIPFDDPLNENVFAAAEAVGLPLCFHIATGTGGHYGLYDDPGLPRLERVLQAFPKLVFLAHSQAFWSEISADVTPENRGTYPRGQVSPGRVVELMRRYPNLHGDLSAGSGLNAISRDPTFGYGFMEEFQDRLYFGTDIANDPQELKQVPYFRKLHDEALISAEAHEKITWRNAARLLELEV